MCAPPRRNCIRPAPRSASPSPTGLPQFKLTGAYGTAALTTATMFAPSTIVWSAVASGTQPIFHGFTLLHQQRAAEAGYDHGRGAIPQHGAAGVPERRRRACGRCNSMPRRCRAQRAALRAASDTLDLARGQYRLGAITYVTLLNAQRSYQQARLAVVQAQAARYADTAALFQALGGGWWNRTDVEPNPLSPDNPRRRRSTSIPARTQPRSSTNDQTHGDHAGRGRRRARRRVRIPGCSRAS